VANCYLIAGLAFLAFMAWRAYLIRAAPPPDAPGGDTEPRLAGPSARPPADVATDLGELRVSDATTHKTP